jgi:hypothetical protein
MAVLVSGVVGWMLTITFCFCMNDFDGIIASPTGCWLLRYSLTLVEELAER